MSVCGLWDCHQSGISHWPLTCRCSGKVRETWHKPTQHPRSRAELGPSPANGPHVVFVLGALVYSSPVSITPQREHGTSCSSSGLWLPDCPLVTVRNHHGASPHSCCPQEPGVQVLETQTPTPAPFYSILASLSPRKPLPCRHSCPSDHHTLAMPWVPRADVPQDHLRSARLEELSQVGACCKHGTLPRSTFPFLLRPQIPPVSHAPRFCRLRSLSPTSHPFTF